MSNEKTIIGMGMIPEGKTWGKCYFNDDNLCRYYGANVWSKYPKCLVEHPNGAKVTITIETSGEENE